MRNAKVEQTRLALEAEFEAKRPKPNKNNQKYLPKDYKGPVTGYYEQVNRYLDTKKERAELSIKKLDATPQITKYPVKRDQSGEETSVERRLLRKGQEYQTKRA